MAERTDFYGSNTPKCSKSPCSFQKTGCSFHSFEPILSKRAKKKSPENPLVYWTFWRRVRDSNPRFLLGTQHFECCTFDHSDNSPCMLFRISSENFWKELTERTTKYSIFEPEKTPDFTGFFSGGNSQLYKKFRVSPVMTTSIPLRIYPRIFARIRLYHKRNHLSRKNKVNLRQNQGFRLKYNLIQAFLCAKV